MINNSNSSNNNEITYGLRTLINVNYMKQIICDIKLMKLENAVAHRHRHCSNWYTYKYCYSCLAQFLNFSLLNLSMSLDICTMCSAGSLLSSGFHIGSLPWSGAAYLALHLSTFVSSVVLS